MAKTKNSFLKATSLVFLAGYMLNAVSFESFHQAVHHHHHAELHTEEAEADACHRAIYHGEVSSECEHQNHVTQTQSDCELCEVLTSRSFEFLISEYSSSGTNCSSPDEKTHGSGFILEPLLPQSFLRGPPSA
jgi:hypothetical protein